MRHRQIATGVSLVLMTVIGAALLTLLLIYARHGIDFTDEGFYLNWISNPWAYATSATQFGFVYHPLYLAADGSVALLRQVNLSLTFLLAFVLAFIVIRRGEPLDPVPSLCFDIMRAFLLAFPVLSVFVLGLSTPSHNSLTLQGVMIVAIGLALMPPSSTLAALLVGVGGVILFLAKPSSAALTGIAALAYILAVDTKPLRTLILATATFLAGIAAAAFLISGGPAAFIERLTAGYANLLTLTREYRLDASFRFDAPKLTAQDTVIFLLLAGAAFGIVRLSRNRPNLESPILILITTVTAAVSVYWLIAPQSLVALSHAASRISLMLAAVPIGLALASWHAWQTKNSPPEAWSRHTNAAALLFACLPFFVAFGTAGNTVRKSAYGSLFWALGAFILVRDSFRDAARRTGVTILLATGLALTVALMAAGMEFPYRQHEALRLQTHPVIIGPHRDKTLLVDEETRRYLAKLGTILDRLGFQPGDRIIDMTGESPGVIYAVGGIALGEPWLLGGYPGSQDFARKILARVSCEDLAKAWILLAPDGRRALSGTILVSAGLSAQHPKAARVRRRSLKDHHVILPPQGDRALAECRRLRESEPSQ